MTKPALDPAPTAAPPSPAQLLRVSRHSQATSAPRDHFLYLPAGYDTDPNARWPVLLFLHGNGERGDAKDELDYLLVNGPLYEAWIQKRDLPFILIVPQLPMFGRDETAEYLRNRQKSQIPTRLEVGTPPRPPEFATPSPMKGALAEKLPPNASRSGPPKGWDELEQDLIDLLDEVLEKYRADPERQYLTGLSYGGYGTWYLASRHPERFAAIVPVVGYGHPDLMEPIARAHLPIWCFAGGRDPSVPVKYFYPGLNRLEALGHTDFRFTIEADMGHDVWARVYAGNDVYTWLLSHVRQGSAKEEKAR
jgi:predicted peptidase